MAPLDFFVNFVRMQERDYIREDSVRVCEKACVCDFFTVCVFIFCHSFFPLVWMLC